MSRLDDELEQLTLEVDDATAAVRTSAEWRVARDLIFEFRALLPPFTPAEREERERRVVTARDHLVLVRERAERAEVENQRERDRRTKEDLGVIDAARGHLRSYTARVGWTFVLTFVLGVFAAPLVILAPLPAVFGARSMATVLRAGQGRIWLLHRGPWDEVERSARLHHGATAFLSVSAVLWFLLAVAPWGNR